MIICTKNVIYTSCARRQEGCRPKDTLSGKRVYPLEKIKHILFRSWYVLETLEDRIYHIILDVAVFVSILSVVAGVLQGQPLFAILSTVLILLFLIVLQYITMRYPKHANTCRILMVLGMNLVLFPIHFFTSGGIHSGMILFHLTGLVLCAMLIYGKRGTMVYLLSLVALEASVALSAVFPEYVQSMTEKQHLTNMLSTLLLASVALYSMFALIMRSYFQERKNNQELMEKLRNLSMMDALSGLYNRRELFRRLEVMYGGASQERKEKLTRAGRYIAMFDVDDFKKLNDTYGHSFGDEVLVAVSKVLHDMIHPEDGEMTARYGGEEFVSVLSAESWAEANQCVEDARKKIYALRWEEHPSVRVSVSGGLIACEDHPDLTKAMHDVDELLYKAKAAGKNQICSDRRE